MSVDHGHDGLGAADDARGEGVEAGDPETGPSRRQREALHRADPDAQARERPRTDGHGVAVDVRGPPPETLEQEGGGRQDMGRMVVGRRQPHLAEGLLVVHERDAAARCGGVDGEYEHDPSIQSVPLH